MVVIRMPTKCWRTFSPPHMFDANWALYLLMKNRTFLIVAMAAVAVLSGMAFGAQAAEGDDGGGLRGHDGVLRAFEIG